MRIAWMLVLALAAGCAARAPLPDLPLPALPQGGISGGVFNAASGSLTADNRAYRVGDVLTVLLQETTEASNRSGSSLSKEAQLAVSPSTVFGRATNRSQLEANAERSFSGDATSTRANALSGALTVMVQEVLPNGLLRVAGEKSVLLNRDEEIVRLAGFVRTADINSANQVSSLRVANARIAYAGRGAAADAGAPGWLARFFLSPWFPL